jgi:hypothetical protein
MCGVRLIAQIRLPRASATTATKVAASVSHARFLIDIICSPPTHLSLQRGG